MVGMRATREEVECVAEWEGDNKRGMSLMELVISTSTGEVIFLFFFFFFFCTQEQPFSSFLRNLFPK